jgi:uncharacterized membrane protein
LQSQLPELVAAGAIGPENARAIERHYESSGPRSNFAFVLLAIVGSALVGAGIVLLIAHNWDELSRAVRSTIAFLPLVIAQALGVFVLIKRNESRPWRESVAIFDVAAVATAISLISQTYQLQGTFAEFMRVWLLLSFPIVYLLCTTLGAVVYMIGAVVWLLERETWAHPSSPMFFWLLLLLVIPYFLICFRRDRGSRETAILAIVLALAAVIGLGSTAEFVKSDFGGVSFAGLLTAIYLSGMKFFPQQGERLHPVALLGGIGIGVTAVVLSFEESWHLTHEIAWSQRDAAGNLALAIEFLFPITAIGLAAFDLALGRSRFSWTAASFPIVVAIAWGIAKHGESFGAGVVINCYALFLGIDILARGIRANSIARANFGLLLIAALAVSRFFDSDLSFVTRGVGFIVVGVGFLVANVILFRKRAAA